MYSPIEESFDFFQQVSCQFTGVKTIFLLDFTSYVVSFPFDYKPTKIAFQVLFQVAP